MVIATFPYDSSDEDTEDDVARPREVPVVDAQPSRESGVEVLRTLTWPPTDQQYGTPMMPRKLVAHSVSAYDLWIQSTLRKEGAGSTDRQRDSIDFRHESIYETSGRRLRKNRRRIIFMAILFTGLFILLVSLAVGLANRRKERKSVSVVHIGKRPPVSTNPDTTFAQSVVLSSNRFLERGSFVRSPNGQYEAGLTESGNFILKDRQGNVIWSTGTGGGVRLFMQSDGNLVLKDGTNKSVWTSQTHANIDAVLVIDDAGMVSVVNEDGTKVWLNGIPRGFYNGPSSRSLTFPTRGIFYYPWFPATFYVNGALVKFESDLGHYSSSDPEVAQAHVADMDYAHIDLSIASWWGPDTHLERARLTMLMDETIAMGSSLKWSVYHENEQNQPPTESIRKDMDYLKKWFAWHPAWAHVEGRPVIFVYNDVGCDVVTRWMDASNGEWYVVLKIFPKYLDCRRQPDHWHQYGVNDGKPLQYDGYSFSVAPGFWRADRETPSTPRVSPEEWCENVQAMANSDEAWHLIISFNEAGEGTNIEPSPHWASATGYGSYLDCLHQFPTSREVSN